MSTLAPLVSSAAYGVSDFLGGVAARRNGATRVIAISYPTSVVGIGLLAPFVAGEVTARALAWGAASGAVMAFAILWFYTALAAGPISVVSPLTAVLVAGLPVPAGLAQGERPAPLAWCGIALGLAAVVLVSREPDKGSGRGMSRRTLLLTVGAGAAFAVSFVLTAEIPEGAGLTPLVAARVAATVIAFAFLLPRRSRSPVPATGLALGVPIFIGLVDVVANIAMYYTFQRGELALGSMVIALYPAFTVGMAVVLLREKVSVVQVWGLTTATMAVVLITYGGGQ